MKERYALKPKDGSSHFKKCRIIELDKEFESVKACAEYLGVKPTNVSAVCLGRYKTCKGYHIEFVV